jgi:DNA-binding FadR family transcriptional regulator
VVSVALGAIRPLHTHSVAHNRETLPAHQRVAEAIQRGHHRKAEEAMRGIVEGARADLIREQNGDAPREENGDTPREQNAEGARTP